MHLSTRSIVAFSLVLLATPALADGGGTSTSRSTTATTSTTRSACGAAWAT